MEKPNEPCETSVTEVATLPKCDGRAGNEWKKVENVGTLSADEVTQEKIVLEASSSREGTVTKNENCTQVAESIKAESTRAGVDNGIEGVQNNEDSIGFVNYGKNASIVGVTRSAEAPGLGRSRKVPPKVPAKPKSRLKHVTELIKNSEVEGEPVESWQGKENKPISANDALQRRVEVSGIRGELVQEKDSSCLRGEREASPEKDGKAKHSVKGKEAPECTIDTAAKDRLEKSHSKIELLQQHLRTKINVATVETYKQKLPKILPKITSFRDVDLNKNLTRRSFDEEFLAKHNFDKQLKIEEKRSPACADPDYVSDTEFSSISSIPVEKPRYSKKVSEVEKRWSGKFLEEYLKRNSSESSKSSYVEELESLSSHGSIDDTDIRFVRQEKGEKDLEVKFEECAKRHQEDSENTTSTIDSGSCYEARIAVIEDDIRNVDLSAVTSSDTISIDGNSARRNSDSSDHTDDKEQVECQERFNGDSSVEIRAPNVIENQRVNNDSKPIHLESEIFLSPEQQSVAEGSAVNCIYSLKDTKPVLVIPQRDAYANFIREFTMDPNMSKCSKEEKKKKKSGLRRLLPGFFSPKDSRKDYKKEYRDRRKRDERYFCRYQQNGNYTRSPDTMNLNEDIKRNVQLDSSLNSSIMEDRLNDKKQEMFVNHRGVANSSTPEHNLQGNKKIFEESRIYGSYMQKLPLSPIRHYEKNVLTDQRVISRTVSDGKKVKQYVYKSGENERRYGLERKHSLQESSQSRFVRNHGASGRVSAPPSERFLIRPRAVHPMDRPLPAIPQKIELTTYENHEEIRKYTETRCAGNVEGPRCSVGSYPSRERRSYDDQDCVIYSDEVRNLEQGQRMALSSGRSSSKYSPSSSQRSADYEDSNYTPNSSQKSEFSPGSSKSGEYYLSSPRTSNCTSPNYFKEKNEQSYESETLGSPQRRPYPVSPTVLVQNAEDRIYDETPRSPFPENNEDVNGNRDSTADMEVSVATDLNAEAENVDNKMNDEISSDSRLKSPCGNSPNRDSPKVRPQSADVRKVTSPLTIIPPEHSSPNTNIRSPNGSTWERILEEAKPASPSVSICVSSTQQGNVQRMSPLISPNRSFNTFRSPTSPVRRAQPSDQILIASPKREMYESPNRCFSNRRELDCSGSPVPIADSPSQVLNSKQSLLKQTIPQRLECQTNPSSPNYNCKPSGICDQDVSGRKCASSPCSTCSSCTSKHLSRPKPVYASKELENRVASPMIANPNEMVTSRSPDSTTSPVPKENSDVADNSEKGHQYRPQDYDGQYDAPKREVVSPVSTQSPRSCESVYVERRVAQSLSSLSSSSSRTDHSKSPQPANSPRQSAPPNRDVRLHEGDVIYAERSRETPVQRQNEPLYGSRVPEAAHYAAKQMSPSKKETMQHLEAFYWQQKALEAQKRSGNNEISPRMNEVPINMPEVREAVYWQQLKKLDEEQQKRIYEQQAIAARNDSTYTRRKSQSPATAAVNSAVHRHDSAPNLAVQQRQANQEQIYWKGSMQQPPQQVRGKPPVMNSKVQNQPVLVVRPQPVVQDRRWQVNDPKPVNFARNGERRSLSLPRRPTHEPGAKLGTLSPARPLYEEEVVNDRKPPPIFKRGSLISNSSSSVEYGSIGTKRVSFSNQSGHDQQPSDRKWPTKHGLALEPPTRKHRTEGDREVGDDVYGNTVPMRQHVDAVEPEAEYDADKPLPPLPRESYWSSRRCNSMREQPHSLMTGQNLNRNKQNIPADGRWREHRKWPPGLNETDCGNEVGETQRILQRGPNEEEWNPNGKGRQSNDAGSACRIEGEGSNELSGSRRGGTGGSGGGVLGGSGSRGSGTSGSGRSRDEPRRHTLSGDHQPSLHHQQFNTAQPLHPLHPHHLPPAHGQYGTPSNRAHTTMDLEMGTKSRQRKSPLARGYPPPSSNMLFDDDPGIMSEVETSSTGFRRGGKQRSSLPVVRTPSKTLERPLGLVFLQYRNETKRALLPNEITSIDTVKALFVRSFPKQLTMEYLDSPHVKVYIHDSNKDMFYELEDLRSHLRDIRDRSVLRLFESTDGVASMPGGPLGVPGGGSGLPPHWEDQSYFSEPEFDSEYQHQHIHKSKNTKNSTSNSGGYYMGNSSTLPRGGSLLRAYSPATSSVVAGPNAPVSQPKTLSTPGGGGVAPAKPLRSYQCSKSPLGSLGGSARFSRDSSVSLYSIPDRIHGESGYMSSPERGGGVGAGSGRYPTGPYSASSSYEDPYYSQYSGTVTPVIDEEASDTELLEESYSLYGVKPPGRPPSGPPRSPFPSGVPPHPPGGQPCDVTRIKVEDVARQIANLTGLVQKVLTHSPSTREYLQVPAGRELYSRSADAGDEFDNQSSFSSASVPLSDDSYLRTDVKPPKLGKDKSVSFEKSVSFSDEPPDMNSPKQHSPQHTADTKPTKPAIKSSTLPRMSSQERERHKPTPSPKPVALAGGPYVYRGDLTLTPEMYNQLRGLQKKAKDLRQEVRNLRRMSQAQAHTVRETIRDTFITIRAMLLSGGDNVWSSGDAEKIRLSREEDLYKQEMLWLEKDLTGLESTVEELRGNVINRKTRVNMSDVENMALILSKASKTVADLKVRFPSLQEGMKGLLSSEMEKVMREEKFLKEEPERLESALKRCKKLTGTLVTLKRLASVQEQRLPNAGSVEAEETPTITPSSAQHSKAAAPVPAERTVVGSASVVGGVGHADTSTPNQQRPENALDALLDELQTFSRPASSLSQVSSSGGGSGGGHPLGMAEIGRSASHVVVPVAPRAPNISDIGRKGSVDSSTNSLAVLTQSGQSGTLRRLHSYPSSSDTDTSPPINRLQVTEGSNNNPPLPPQKAAPPPAVPERNIELLQMANARRVPPPPPPRTSSRSPLASPTSPQLPPRNPTGTLRRSRGSMIKESKPPMALPANTTSSIAVTTATITTTTTVATTDETVTGQGNQSVILSTSNSSSCESINSQEGLQKKGRQEQLEQRHQELLRKQKALQEQYARLQQLQRNASGLTTVPPAPPDLLKKTGSESNLLAKMGLGLSTASSGSLTSLTGKLVQEKHTNQQPSQQTTISKIYETDIL